MVKRAFSLVELLVVMAIIALLAGLVIAGIGRAKESARRSRSDAILAGVRSALEVAGASGAVSIGFVEHPLAGSAAPRQGFVRAADGSEVAATGEALMVQDPAWVPGEDRTRVLLADDRFRGAPPERATEPALPLLYGMPRSRLTILGATDTFITRWRRLPSPQAGFEDPARRGVLKGPYGPPLYPDNLYLHAPELERGDTVEAASEAVLKRALSVHWDELLKLGAVRSAAASWPALFDGRLREDPAGGGTAKRWQPGRCARAAGEWVAYRLRGVALYDAWGGEILCSHRSDGGIRVESAGRDGVFIVDPGPDGAVQTPPAAAATEGDDRDGRADNLGGREGN